MNYCPCCDVFYETMELWERNHPLVSGEGDSS